MTNQDHNKLLSLIHDYGENKFEMGVAVGIFSLLDDSNISIKDTETYIKYQNESEEVFEKILKILDNNQTT